MVFKLEEITLLENSFFRKVLQTGKHAQLVLMCLIPSEEIGIEVHPNVDQFFRIEKGTGKVVQDGVEEVITDGSAFIVLAGTKHNIINTSDNEDLKLYTVYSPPNHPDGTIHKTKAEAEEHENR